MIFEALFCRVSRLVSVLLLEEEEDGAGGEGAGKKDEEDAGTFIAGVRGGWRAERKGASLQRKMEMVAWKL